VCKEGRNPVLARGRSCYILGGLGLVTLFSLEKIWTKKQVEKGNEEKKRRCVVKRPWVCMYIRGELMCVHTAMKKKIQQESNNTNLEP